MQNKSNVGSHLVGGAKKVGTVTEKQREPYYLPCGNTQEYCFMQVNRKNARFCATWKRIIWGKCRHHVETPNCKWEER